MSSAWLFNPGCPCCASGPSVIIWGHPGILGAGRSVMAAEFDALNGPTETVDLVGVDTTWFRNNPVKTANAGIIIISVINDVNLFDGFLVTDLGNWLSLGNKRLIVAGEYGQAFPSLNLGATNLVSSLGSTMSLTTGNGDIDLGPYGCVGPPGGSGNAAEAISNGISFHYAATSSVIIGSGRELFYIVNPGAAQTNVLQAVEQIGTSEIILHADESSFDDACWSNANESTLWAERILQIPIPS